MPLVGTLLITFAHFTIHLFYTEQMDAEGLGRKLLLNPLCWPLQNPWKADRGYCDGISKNAKPASTFELSQCRRSKGGLPGPRRGFSVPSGSLSPRTAASLVARAIRNVIRANRFARIIRNWNPYLYNANRLIRPNHSNFRFARITRFARIVRIDSRESRH